MRKKNTKSRKLGSIGNGVEEYNILCIRRATEINMINGSHKKGYLMQERQLKIIGQGIWVKTYKKGGKIPLWTVQTIHLNFKMQMSSQSFNNNNYATAPTSPNPYISRKLNNMDQAQVIKKEWEDWTRTYYKTLKGIEAMIDVQRIIKNMKKLAREANTTVTEMKGFILAASIDNQTTNITNIVGISEDLRYLVQSDMEDWVFQIQRMLADELDRYKRRGNIYVDENIWEIQELYINEEQTKKDEGRVEDKEVILIKLYEVSKSTSTKSSSFINKEVDNLLKYMKFIKSSTQIRIFRPPPYYQALWSRRE